jgi:tRNA (cytidine56-2'-O)-methyltransferase
MEEIESQRISILRLGHRPSRDKRISTHLLLAARAFGAHDAVYTGIKDVALEESISKVVQEWGGDFSVGYSGSWKKVTNAWKGRIIHLTMYGLPVEDVIAEIKADRFPKLIVVGGAKVPSEIYGVADWNVAVTNQPHSEVSALALFLHELHGGKELSLKFPGAKLTIVPQAKMKKINFINYRHVE